MNEKIRSIMTQKTLTEKDIDFLLEHIVLLSHEDKVRLGLAILTTSTQEEPEEKPVIEPEIVEEKPIEAKPKRRSKKV